MAWGKFFFGQLVQKDQKQEKNVSIWCGTHRHVNIFCFRFHQKNSRKKLHILYQGSIGKKFFVRQLLTGQSGWEFFFPENNDVFSNLTDDMLFNPPDFFTNGGHIGVQYTIKIWTHNSYPLGRKTKNNFFPPMASKEI